MKARRLLVCCVFLVVVTGCKTPDSKQKPPGVITYSQLASRLMDLRHLATLPLPGEKSAMWSSYDRRSRVSPDSGFVNWSANDDGFNPQYRRKEGENMVLAEMTGPGAIVRMWSANPGKGKVKIYIDGNEKPVINGSFRDYFSGELDVFDFPALVYETSARGFNNYVPIPYAKSCKIVAEPDWGQYYHFNYITFPEGTLVESFSGKPDREGMNALAEVNSFLSQRAGLSPYRTSGTKRDSIMITIEPNQRLSPIIVDGSRAITGLHVTLHTPNSIKVAEILRKVTLQMTWDGNSDPAVWAPLGDFFGSAPGLNSYKTLAMSVNGNRMSSWWYMPFEQGAEIIMQNDSHEPVQFTLEVEHESIHGDVKDMGRFHAKWHRDLPTKLDSSRWPDWTVLEVDGRGRFVGMALSVWNPKGGSCKVHGGEGHYWWGEGDEKFFVDGETFPSTFGTGTEDYFGYAWCAPDRFERAFHSQTIDSDNMGYQAVNRWQIIDNVPFQNSFDAYLEKYFPNEWPTQYAVMAYWYMAPGGSDEIPAVPVSERFGYEIPYNVFREVDVIEGEMMKIEKNSGGWATTEVWVDENLFSLVSNHKALKWLPNPATEGTLNVSFFWPEDGLYEVQMHVVQSMDGGNFQVRLNGNDLAGVNFNTLLDAPSTKLVSLGTINIKAGKQDLKFRWKNSDPKRNHLQMDYVRLVKREAR